MGHRRTHTRREGRAASAEVAPRVRRSFGAAIPSEMDGEPIHATADPAPFDLYHRELQYRRMRLPVQAGAGVFVWTAGVVLIWALVARARRHPIGGGKCSADPEAAAAAGHASRPPP